MQPPLSAVGVKAPLNKRTHCFTRGQVPLRAPQAGLGDFETIPIHEPAASAVRSLTISLGSRREIIPLASRNNASNLKGK